MAETFTADHKEENGMFTISFTIIDLIVYAVCGIPMIYTGILLCKGGK